MEKEKGIKNGKCTVCNKGQAEYPFGVQTLCKECQRDMEACFEAANSPTNSKT